MSVLLPKESAALAGGVGVGVTLCAAAMAAAKGGVGTAAFGLGVRGKPISESGGLSMALASTGDAEFAFSSVIGCIEATSECVDFMLLSLRWSDDEA